MITSKETIVTCPYFLFNCYLCSSEKQNKTNKKNIINQNNKIKKQHVIQDFGEKNKLLFCIKFIGILNKILKEVI